MSIQQPRRNDSRQQFSMQSSKQDFMNSTDAQPGPASEGMATVPPPIKEEKRYSSIVRTDKSKFKGMNNSNGFNGELAEVPQAEFISPRPRTNQVHGERFMSLREPKK